eukprot:Nitzschia sp. Nitz4//scaffold70_size99833//23601//25011//NITZ4_004588-RA/size99833-snap-gene-0.129-mRNA-1//1//CDS//3329557114//264//frame0
MTGKKTLGQPSASEEGASPYPPMNLAQQIHQCHVQAPGIVDAAFQTKLLETIATELENPTLYQSLQSVVVGVTGPLTDSAIQEMVQKHKDHLQSLEDKVEEAKENAGDMEVLDARVSIARFAAKSMSKDQAIEAYEKLLALPKISTGKKVDAWMELARVASFYGDHKKSADFIDSAQKLASEGGGTDWDRRNRLKVYRGLARLLERDMKGAATLLLDCLATFSCSEICSYDEYVRYTILSNLLTLPRPEIKAKLLDGPEVLSVATDIPETLNLIRSLYDCDYKSYLHAMLAMEPILQADRYLHPHMAYWMRELHILAYKQFLDSYQSVTLQAMADAFGVSTDFIDHHASHFIAAGRLSAKIDKYGGVIITNRPDLKNAQYREMIQKGDLLLNRIQKLARVVDM